MFTSFFASIWAKVIGLGLVAALAGLIVWRIYAKGEAAAKADILIAGMAKAIQANQAKQAELTRTPAQKETDRANDPNNRDNW